MTASFLSKFQRLPSATAENAAGANPCTNRHTRANRQSRAITKTVEVRIVTNAIEVYVASSNANARSNTCAVTGACAGHCAGIATPPISAGTTTLGKSRTGNSQSNDQSKYKSQIKVSFHDLISIFFH
jgi:hypothetical protein